MHFKFNNVNDAFEGLVRGIHVGEIPVDVCASRNGEVLKISEPVIITYQNPRQRVLFNAARDANPFFHAFEALWMLAGRNDIAPLCYYVKSYADYSDDGKTANGAYGFRWRKFWDYEVCESSGRHEGPVDQLKVVIDHLRNKPESRRAVLSMWNVEDDLLKIDSSRDVCCNLSVCFDIELGMCLECDGDGYVGVDDGLKEIASGLEPRDKVCPKCGGTPSEQPRYLNMTVFNRSNDLIWGALGANVVHFSFLQEYVANCLGLEVGVYNQVSNNLHVYTKNWRPQDWLAETINRDMFSPEIVKYGDGGVRECSIPLVTDQETFDREVQTFVDLNYRPEDMRGDSVHYSEPFLEDVARPMCHAFHMHKQRDYTGAYYWAGMIRSKDWQLASETWIGKRKTVYEAKELRS